MALRSRFDNCRIGGIATAPKGAPADRITGAPAIGTEAGVVGAGAEGAGAAVLAVGGAIVAAGAVRGVRGARGARIDLNTPIVPRTTMRQIRNAAGIAKAINTTAILPPFKVFRLWARGVMP